MSLLIAFHESDRAVVCSDQLAISFSENGEPVPSAEKVSKFIVIGALIFVAVGRSDICRVLNVGTRRMLAENSFSIVQVAQILPEILRQQWAARKPNPNAPLMYDALECAVIGHDGSRIRSFVFTSGDNFRPVETTADDRNRIFALGAYDAADSRRLQRLTQTMERANDKPPSWIASHLEACVEDLHARSPRVIGEPFFFGAIDRNGVVVLPPRFMRAPGAGLAAVVATNFVTVNKEDAFNGTTRFFLGSITTPGPGGPDTIGNDDGGVTAQSGKRSVLGFAMVPVWNTSAAQISNPLNVSGTGSSITDPQASIDGSGTTASVLTSTGNGTTNSTQLQLAAAPGIGARQFTSATLNITREVTTNSVAGGAGIVYTLSYTTDGGKTFTNIESLSVGGGTIAKSTISVTLAIPFNPTLTSFHINTSALSGMTSGTIVAKIYDASIVVTE